MNPLDRARSAVGPDGKRRGASGRAKLWAHGTGTIADLAGCTKRAVIEAIAAKRFDPTCLLSTTAWICERQKQHELAAGLRAMVRARVRP